MIRMSSAFELAYARWRGEPIEIGPCKTPATAVADELDRAFTECESAELDRLARALDPDVSRR